MYSYGLASENEEKIKLDPLVREIALELHEWPDLSKKRKYMTALLEVILENAGECSGPLTLALLKQKQDYAQALERLLEVMGEDALFRTEQMIQIAKAKLFIAEAKVQQRLSLKALALLDEIYPILRLDGPYLQIRMHLERVQALIQEQNPRAFIEKINEELNQAKLRIDVCMREHPDQIGVTRLLGQYYQLKANAFGLQIKIAESVAAREQALEVYQKINDEPGLTETHYWLGFSKRTVGDLLQAKMHYDKALAFANSVYEDQHPTRLKILADLASIERQLGNLENAEKYANDALTKSEEIQGRFSQSTTLIRAEYLRILVDQGRPMALCQKQMDTLVYAFESIGQQLADLSKARIYMTIARAYLKEKNFIRAEVCINEGAKLRKILPADHSERAETEYYFALLAYQQKRFDEADRCLQSVEALYNLPKYAALKNKIDYLDFLELKANVLLQKGELKVGVASLEDLASRLKSLGLFDTKLKEIAIRLHELYPDMASSSISDVRASIVLPIRKEIQRAKQEELIAARIERIQILI